MDPNIPVTPPSVPPEIQAPPTNTVPPPIAEIPPPAPIKKSRKPLILVILAFILLMIAGALILAQFYGKKVEQSMTPSTTSEPSVISSEKLIIGTDATYQPMEFVDDNGNLIGYDIELGYKIGEKLNREIEFKNIAWDDLFKELHEGRIDMIISGVTITKERMAIYDFSAPYINAGQVIITRKETLDINNVNSLQGKKIAVQKGTTNEEEAKKYTQAENVIAFDNFEDATSALISSEADAIFSDLTNAKGIITEYPTLKIASEPFTDEQYGVVFKKGNFELVTSVNQALDELRQQGVQVYLKQKWLE